MDIIQYFLNYVTTLYQNYCWLLMFVCKYIPLRQWAFEVWQAGRPGQAPLRM